MLLLFGIIMLCLLKKELEVSIMSNNKTSKPGSLNESAKSVPPAQFQRPKPPVKQSKD